MSLSISPEESLQKNTLVEGQVFEGRYQILSVLGTGGVGVVYKARHMHMDKIVAIKTLLSSVVTDDEESFQRFAREARTASSLDHVNIIKIYDFDKTSSGLAFLVMEYLGRQTLENLLIENRRLDIDRFLSISVQICDGLNYAHKHKVIHRDIKPSNIMLLKVEDNPECVKIVDFGLAKLSSQETAQNLTKTGAIVGTPLFMSPEQCRGLALDNRSDIYSLGCVFYLALTGRVPIQGATALDTLFQHTSLKPPSFASIDVGLHLPPRLEEAILKALEKDPDLRQQSMLELRNDIQKAIFDPSFRASAAPPPSTALAVPGASTISSGFPAHIVSADDAVSGRYVDLVDSASTVVSMNQALASSTIAKPSQDNSSAVTGESADSADKSIKQLRSVQQDVAQLHSPDFVSTRGVQVRTATFALGIGVVLIAVTAAVFLFKPTNSPIAAMSMLQPVKSFALNQSIVPKVETVMMQPRKKNAREKKAKPEVKLSPVDVARKAPEPKELSSRQSDLEQIEEYQKSARLSLDRNDWTGAQNSYYSCLRLQEKTFGARHFRLFTTLSAIIHCQHMLKNDSQTRVYLMPALAIFSSQKSDVLKTVSKRPQAYRIWRTLAYACFQNGEQSHDLALLDWSADFYELAKGSWTADKGDREYIQLCKAYCNVLEICGNRKKENMVRAEIHLPPLTDLPLPAKSKSQKPMPQKAIQQGFTRRAGNMVIRTYR